MTQPEPRVAVEAELAEIEVLLATYEDEALAPNALLTRRYELSRALAGHRAEMSDTVSGDRVQLAAFVIMPFRAPFNDYYSEIIKPAATDAGYGIVRSDEIYSPGAFVQTIWEQILVADVVIAEMTGANANVLYELGLSHAVAKKVVMLTQDISDVPSDLRHINCIVYDTSRVNWVAQTRSAIQRMLLFEPRRAPKPILDPPASVDNTTMFADMLTEIRTLKRSVDGLKARAARASAAALAAERDLALSKDALSARLLAAPDGAPVTVYMHDGKPHATLAVPGASPLDFVRVPAGAFILGAGGSAERTEIASYWMSQYPVTNDQYCAFLNAKGNQDEGGALWMDLNGASPADRCRIRFASGHFNVESGYERYPVTYVNYYGAAAFCAWLGCELPTVEQWEKAVRGTDGREYPWGNAPPSASVANLGPDGWDRDVAPIAVNLKPDGVSPFGVVQGIGNVWHWTRTYFPDRNVQAVRGGSFFDFRLGSRQVYRFVVAPDGPDFSQSFMVCRRFMGADEDVVS